MNIFITIPFYSSIFFSSFSFSFLKRFNFILEANLRVAKTHKTKKSGVMMFIKIIFTILNA